MTAPGIPPGSIHPQSRAGPRTPFRDWRLRNNLNQAQVAEALDIAKRTVGGYDRGQDPVPRAIELAMLGYECKPLLTQAADAIAGLLESDSPRDDTALQAKSVLLTLLDHMDDIEIAADGGLGNAAAAIAALEGWGVYWSDKHWRPYIGRDPTRNVFLDDAKALAHVRRQAKAGSRLHKLALMLHNRKETEV